MAFVSDAVIDKWFQTDSWVYKNFSIWFSNRIWKGRVPKGFSLCPYFWIAIAGFLIGKPIVIPLAALIKVIITGLGFITWKPLAVYDSWLRKHIGMPSKGAGIAITLFAIAALIIFGLAIWFVGTLVKIWFLGCAPFQRYWIVYIPIMVISLLITGIYNKKHEYEDDRCKTEWYSLALFIILTGIMFISFPESITFLVSSTQGVWWAICTLFCKIGQGFSIALHYIGMAIWFIWTLIKTLAFARVIGVPIILAVVALSLLSYAGMAMYDKNEQYKASQWKLSIDDIKNLLLSRVNQKNSELWYQVKEIVEKDTINTVPELKCLIYIRQILKNIIDGLTITIPDNIASLSYSDFLIVHSVCINPGIQSLTPIQCIAVEYISQLRLEVRSIVYDINNEKVEIPNSVAIVLAEVKKADKEISEENKVESEATKRRKELCKKATETTKAAMSVVTYIPIKSWKITKWIGIQIGTLCVYLWVVGKSVKQGACPYRTFKKAETPKI